MSLNRWSRPALVLAVVLSACSTVKQDEKYFSRITNERVRVAFVGSERLMVERYGERLKYERDRSDSVYVMCEPLDRMQPGFSGRTILSQSKFLTEYSRIK